MMFVQMTLEETEVASLPVASPSNDCCLQGWKVAEKKTEG